MMSFRIHNFFDRHCEQSEAIQTKPQLETPSLARFALLAMTKSEAFAS